MNTSRRAFLKTAFASTIANGEVVVAYLVEDRGWRRGKASTWVGLSVWLVSLGTVFSFNLWKDWRPLAAIDKYKDFGYFEMLDYLTANIMILCKKMGGVILGYLALVSTFASMAVGAWQASIMVAEAPAGSEDGAGSMVRAAATSAVCSETRAFASPRSP